MDIIEFKELSINKLKEQLTQHSAFYLKNTGGELFNAKNSKDKVVGVLFDIMSINAICKIYDAINEKNKEKFNSILLKDEYKFARFLDTMWDLVSIKGFTKEV